MQTKRVQVVWQDGRERGGRKGTRKRKSDKLCSLICGQLIKHLQLRPQTTVLSILGFVLFSLLFL